MSIEALSWAFNLELPSSGAKLTLLALANYASSEGEAFPSQKAMALKTCLCERAIRTHLASLEALGVISRISRTRANGSFTTDLFKLNVGYVLEESKRTQRQILPTAKKDINQRQILPNPAAEYAAPESSLTTTFTKNNLTPTPKTSRINPLDDGFEEFWNQYPKKVGKTVAHAAWKKQKVNIDKVLNTLQWQVNSDQWQKADGQFIPNPTTYINQGRWHDEPPRASIGSPF